MDYQNKYKNFKLQSFSLRGFSLIELLIVIAIILIILSVSSNSFNTFKKHNNLAVAVNGTVEALRFAQASAQSGKIDGNWGVKILTNELIIFKGNSYDSRDTLYDEHLSFSGGISTSGVNEIVFEKISGKTSNTGIITFTNNEEVKDLNINEKGTITY